MAPVNGEASFAEVFCRNFLIAIQDGFSCQVSNRKKMRVDTQFSKKRSTLVVDVKGPSGFCHKGKAGREMFAAGLLGKKKVRSLSEAPISILQEVLASSQAIEFVRRYHQAQGRIIGFIAFIPSLHVEASAGLQAL